MAYKKYVDKDHYGVVFRFNCISKILTVISYENHVHRGVYFTDELNLKECTIRGESFELVTRLYAYGNEGLTFSSINNGKEYIDNNSYSNKVISDVWVDERYKSVVELKRAAEQRLAKSTVPNRVYTASFVDIANLNPEYSCLSVAIGDRITLVDRVRKVKIEHQIMKIVRFPLEPERNMLELGQLQKTLENTITNISTKTAEKAIHTAQLGNIDMIITKSISRFARNTLDCLKYIRQLKDKNIPVFFEKENINSMDSKGEVMLTIMASLAQQESQSLSQNIKMGLQYRYQQGKVPINHKRFLGYTKDADGNLIIDAPQAEIVKRIYREYLEGASMDKIATGLEEDGILTGAGGAKWHTSTIKKILTNEKYMGDALLQKTYTTDFLTKKRIKNNGIVPQYYIEDNHPAIIPKDLYMLVQEELIRRRVVHTSPSGKKHSYSGNHCFSQIVFCGECGEMYRRIHWNNRGCKSIVWRCISRVEHTEHICHSRTVNELLLREIVLKAINQTLGDKDNLIKTLQENIAKAVRESDVTSSDGIDERLNELQHELLKKAHKKEEYDTVADEIFRLRELKSQSETDSVARDEKLSRIMDLQDFVASQSTELTKFDENLVKRLIGKITVFEDKFTVEFKSGVQIEG